MLKHRYHTSCKTEIGYPNMSRRSFLGIFYVPTWVVWQPCSQFLVIYLLNLRGQSSAAASGGLHAGMDQKSIRDNELHFDNQFDGGGHNPGINGNENFDNLTTLSATVSGGVSYRWRLGLRFSLLHGFIFFMVMFSSVFLNSNLHFPESL